MTGIDQRNVVVKWIGPEKESARGPYKSVLCVAEEYADAGKDGTPDDAKFWVLLNPPYSVSSGSKGYVESNGNNWQLTVTEQGSSQQSQATSGSKKGGGGGGGSFNRVILMGNLTRDVELKHTKSGTAVASVGLAMNSKRKVNDEMVDETTFVDVTFWGRQAELVSEYLGKGSPIFVEGRLKLDTWETDGQKRSKLHVVAERMQFIGGDEYRQPAEPQQTSDDGPDDSIPF